RRAACLAPADGARLRAAAVGVALRRWPGLALGILCLGGGAFATLEVARAALKRPAERMLARSCGLPPAEGEIGAVERALPATLRFDRVTAGVYTAGVVDVDAGLLATLSGRLLIERVHARDVRLGERGGADELWLLHPQDRPRIVARAATGWVRGVPFRV